jgi:hypothetical protein
MGGREGERDHISHVIKMISPCELKPLPAMTSSQSGSHMFPAPLIRALSGCLRVEVRGRIPLGDVGELRGVVCVAERAHVKL